jgi:hypothetical protein
MELQRDLQQGFAELAAAEAARGNARTFTLTDITQAARPRSTFVDAATAESKYGITRSHTGGSYGGGYGASREDAYANSAHSVAKTGSALSLCMAVFAIMALHQQ